MERTRWSWRLGSLFGIAVRVHVTLIALLAWVIVASPLRGDGFVVGLFDLALVMAIFAIVVVHELAHALVARRFGSTTREILLLPIGGIANIDKLPRRPVQELFVAIAGPTVNVVLAVVMALILAIAGADFFPSPVADLATFGAQLFWINVVLAGFNMIPAFPMDGGRAFRALLAMNMGYARATRIAVSAAYIIAIGFVFFGILHNPLLALIGFFVWTLARQELATITVRERLRGTVAQDAMIRSLDPVDPDGDPYEVADRMVADGVRVLPVVDGRRILGVITTDGILRGLRGRDLHDAIRNVTRTVPIVTREKPLADVVDALDKADAVLVADDGVLVGMLTLDQIEMFGELVEEPGLGRFPRTLEAR